MPIKTRIDMLSTGIKTPVGIKVLGPDLKVLSDLAQQASNVVKTDERTGPYTVSAFAEKTVGGTYLDIAVNRDEIARYGLNVADVQEVDEPRFVCGRALRVGIFLSPFSVHVNRAPCTGMAMYYRYAAGEFLPAYNPRAPERNEAVELGLVTPRGLKVLVKQIAGVLARRIVCEARPGQVLARGERYGMIKFGSRTELYVPVESGYRAVVVVGQWVRGGETPLLRGEPAPAAAACEPGTASTCGATC
jgi:phosphatidylserine decarboxylase precursor-related protein